MSHVTDTYTLYHTQDLTAVPVCVNRHVVAGDVLIHGCVDDVTTGNISFTQREKPRPVSGYARPQLAPPAELEEDEESSEEDVEEEEEPESEGEVVMADD